MCGIAAMLRESPENLVRNTISRDLSLTTRACRRLACYGNCCRRRLHYATRACTSGAAMTPFGWVPAHMWEVLEELAKVAKRQTRLFSNSVKVMDTMGITLSADERTEQVRST